MTGKTLTARRGVRASQETSVVSRTQPRGPNIGHDGGSEQGRNCRRSVIALVRSATPLRRAMLVLFLAAFAVRFTLALAFPNLHTWDRGEMEHVAVAWATTGQLANPYATPTGATAHVAPIYPMLLGSIYRLFGLGAKGHLMQAALSCACSAARSSLLVLLAVLLGLGFRTGVLAGWLSVVYLSEFSTELRGHWEAPLAGLFLMVFTALALRFHRAPRFRLRGALGYGALAGSGVLLSPTLAPPMAAFVACTIPLGVQHRARSALWVVMVAAVAALVMLPWLIRNQRLLGSPVLRSNFGLELSLAYNDTENAGGDRFVAHPFRNQAVSRQVASMGEVAFNRVRKQQALAWIRQHPGAAVRLSGEHVVDFWFPPQAHLALAIPLYGFTLSSLLGFALLVRQKLLAGWVIGLIWLTFPWIYYVISYSSRYRYPMEWTLLLSSAVLIEAAQSLWWHDLRRRFFGGLTGAKQVSGHC